MPLVAMTREMGSLGTEVASRLSQRLGKETVHHEIIDALADKMRLRKSHVVRFLEGKAGIWERMTTDRTSLAIYTAGEIFRVIENGNVGVLHGWGAAHLLRPIPHVVCVRVCAPFATRVARMMERLNTDDREFVEGEIRHSEEAHTAITRRHFGVDWQQSEHYDLVLNTERIPVDACADKIASVLAQPQFQETSDSTRILANLALQNHVRAALRQDPRTSRMNVTVEAADGRVALAGILEAGLDERDAIDVVSALRGVTEVECGLRTAALPRYKLDS